MLLRIPISPVNLGLPSPSILIQSGGQFIDEQRLPILLVNTTQADVFHVPSKGEFAVSDV